MKKALAFVFTAALAASAFAQEQAVELKHGPISTPSKYAGGGGAGGNLSYHTGGTVIRNANVVLIFWGPSFTGADASYASQLQSFRNQFGTTGEYNTITQYYGEDPVSGYGNIAQSSLAGSQADWFDTTTPPQNVPDATVQSEVQKYVAAHGTDYNTIYEVFLPK